MEKKNVFGLGLLLAVLIVIGGSIYYLYIQREDNILNDIPDENVPRVQEPSSYDNLNLQYNYKGNNIWEYQVTGTLPNPCYGIFTEAVVMESYPEQVVIKSIIKPPDEDVVCTQVIQEVYEEGEFQASGEAEVTFEIEEGDYDTLFKESSNESRGCPPLTLTTRVIAKLF